MKGLGRFRDEGFRFSGLRDRVSCILGLGFKGSEVYSL